MNDTVQKSTRRTKANGRSKVRDNSYWKQLTTPYSNDAIRLQ